MDPSFCNTFAAATNCFSYRVLDTPLFSIKCMVTSMHCAFDSPDYLQRPCCICTHPESHNCYCSHCYQQNFRLHILPRQQLFRPGIQFYSTVLSQTYPHSTDQTLEHPLLSCSRPSPRFSLLSSQVSFLVSTPLPHISLQLVVPQSEFSQSQPASMVSHVLLQPSSLSVLLSSHIS